MENKAEDGLVLVEEFEIQPIEMGMLSAKNPAMMLLVAREIAAPLRDLILKQGLFVQFGKKKHVTIEGWSTMLSMLSVFPQELSVTKDPVGIDGWGYEYTAKMALVRVDDQKVVSAASAECGGEGERDWHFRPKYVWEGPDGNRIKKCVGEESVSGNARRSMALTRATSKAARLAFAWIMELAEFSPTPAEEMPQDTTVDPDRKQQPDGKDPLGRKKTQPKSKATEVRRMTANQPFTCGLCGGPGKANEDIAFYMDENGDPHSTHWDPCYLDTQNAKEGQ